MAHSGFAPRLNLRCSANVSIALRPTAAILLARLIRNSVDRSTAGSMARVIAPKSLRGCLAVLPMIILAAPALAHARESTGGFLAGLSHPIFGLDHVVAMVAVGLWRAF